MNHPRSISQLHIQYENNLNMKNRFRNLEFCGRFVAQMKAVLVNRIKYRLHDQFDNLPFGVQMAICLCVLPAVIDGSTPVKPGTFNNFISVYPSLADFIVALPPGRDGPYLCIIGRLFEPVSYVICYQKRVFRCLELWQAVDIGVKVLAVDRVMLPLSTVRAWQFIMTFFYNLENEMQFIYPSVKKLIQQIVFSTQNEIEA